MIETIDEFNAIAYLKKHKTALKRPTNINEAIDQIENQISVVKTQYTN